MLLTALASGILVTGSFALGLFAGPERALEDRLFTRKDIDPRIVILVIDSESIHSIGQWPWPREVYAQIFAKLSKHPPLGVGFDVILSEESRLGKQDDAAFARTLSSTPFPVVMPREENPPLLPLPLFREKPTVSLGQVQFVVDPDGVVRSAQLADSFAWQNAKLLSPSLENPPKTPSRIVFRGAPGDFRTVSVLELLTDESVAASLEGKLVLIGATASDLHDEQVVPTSNGKAMSGVELQAHAIQMLARGESLVPISRGLMMLILLLSALCAGASFIFLSRASNAIATNSLLGIVSLGAALLLFDIGIIANLLHLALAWIVSTASLFAYRYFITERSRREMRQAFSKYVSRDILEEILRDPSKVKLGGDEKEATVFFSDVRGFTTLSESLTATGLVQFLNKYLTRMTDIALARRGVVDKYIGDAIMAFWGAPLDNPRQAEDAVEASLEMIDALAAFNGESAANGEPPIDIGIGLNTGPVVAGNMGSNERFDYTVMGDTVNLASRLESQTKTYGVHILAAEATIKALPEGKYVVRELDKIKVKGKKLPATIYEIAENAKRETVKSILPFFNQARDLYYHGEFSRAAELFKKILSDHVDAPSKLLFERCEHFLAEPPEKWEGVYEFKTK